MNITSKLHLFSIVMNISSIWKLHNNHLRHHAELEYMYTFAIKPERARKKVQYFANGNSYYL